MMMGSMARAPRAPLAVLLLALALAACGAKEQYLKDLEGEVPPALDTMSTTWLNTDPLTLSSLRGKVVYLEFGFHG
jgi:hypothetical protein